MGEWLNAAFLHTQDLVAVRQAIESAIDDAGRAIVAPASRGLASDAALVSYARDAAPRWCFAAFPGAPGWTVLRIP